MLGESRRLSLSTLGSLMNAALGAESGVLVDVTQRMPSGLVALLATHPAGSAGAVTPSKFSESPVPHGVGVGGPAVAVGVGVAVGGGVGVGVQPGQIVGVGNGVGVACPQHI